VVQVFAVDYDIQFNTHKSEGFIAIPRSQQYVHHYISSCKFLTASNLTEIVENFTHLGHVIYSNMDEIYDIQIKSGVLINQANNVLCCFKKLDSFVKCHFYRSCIT
jgi:hypothetical protein